MAGLVALLIGTALLLSAPAASANTLWSGLDVLITPNETVLLLIDHQPFQFADLHSHEPLLVQNNVITLAKAAKIFDIPVIITSVLAERGGYFIKGVTDVFPDVEVIDRTYINAWQDSRVVNAVMATGKKKLVVAALWTEICLALPVLQAMGDGYEVYFVTDASGGKSKESHEMGVLRMTQAGAIPLTTNVFVFELQRDWARETQWAVLDLMQQNMGGSGIAYGWEHQLLTECTEVESSSTGAGSSGMASSGGGVMSSGGSMMSSGSTSGGTSGGGTR